MYKLIETNSDIIKTSWMKSIEEILQNKNIDVIYFRDYYANDILEFVIDRFKKKKEKACPTVQKFLEYFKEYNITSSELYMICSNLKHTIINEHIKYNKLDKKTNTYIFKILDENFSTILDIYDNTISKQEKLLTEHEYILIEILSKIGEYKDASLKTHIFNVSKYAKMLAKAVNEHTKDTIKDVKLFSKLAALHDLGKIGIPTEILLKPSKLTDEEFEVIKSHPQIGYDLIKEYDSLTLIETASKIIHQHHEKYDGTGYPNKLKNKEISIEARISTIADVYDALTTERVYKKAWDYEDVKRYFFKEKGKSFDPLLVDLFFKALESLL